MKYVQPVGETINSGYSNGNTQDGTLGSIIPAQAIEHPMREIVNVIKEGGLTPDANDNEQLYKALRRLCAPAGEIRMWGGNHIPDGFLHCNGQAIDRSIYADLFAAISTTHGNGNGRTTFNLPDLRDKFVLGATSYWNKQAGDTGGGFGKTVNTGYKTVNINGETDGHALTIAEMPSHTHSLKRSKSSGTVSANSSGGSIVYHHVYGSFTSTGAASAGGDTTHDHNVNITNTGNHNHSVSVDVTPPYIALIHIIRT